MGEPWQKLEKHLTDFRSRKEGRSTKYFIPCEMLTDKAKANMAARFEEVSDELDDFSKEVEDIIGDVSGAEFAVTLDDRLREAQLSNLTARTKALGEKMERNRQQIWNSWNEQFFECFTVAFARFKNTLVGLQLSEEQLKSLNEGLDIALASMKDKLDFMYNDFIENGMEDKED